MKVRNFIYISFIYFDFIICLTFSISPIPFNLTVPSFSKRISNLFVIEKKSMEESTVTAIAEIRGDAILDELARMLGSDTITESSLANARELKEMAANTKQY